MSGNRVIAIWKADIFQIIHNKRRSFKYRFYELFTNIFESFYQENFAWNVEEDRKKVASKEVRSCYKCKNCFIEVLYHF